MSYISLAASCYKTVGRDVKKDITIIILYTLGRSAQFKSYSVDFKHAFSRLPVNIFVIDVIIITYLIAHIPTYDVKNSL